MADIDVDVRGLPETKRLLAQFQGAKLNNRMRRSLRAGAKAFREEMRREAKSRHDLPRTFAKTRTRAHRNPIGVSVSPGSPLSNIFEHGAKRHEIGDGAKILANAATGFFARGSVSHPGMAARPFIAPVFAAAQGDATKAAADVLFEGIDRGGSATGVGGAEE